MAEIAKVQGNPFALSVALQRQRVTTTSEGVEREVYDFFPAAGHPVLATLQCGAYRQRVEAVMTGNVAVMRFDASLDAGTYGLEVTCTDSDGQPCRWKKGDVVEITDESAQAGLAEGVEFDDTPYHLGAAIFPGVVIADMGGGGQAMATVGSFPIVHRGLPMTPREGSCYYYEQEVRLKFPTLQDAARALEAMQCLNPRKINVFQDRKPISIDDLADMDSSRKQTVQVCLSFGHVQLRCVKGGLLQEDGTVNYAWLAEQLNEGYLTRDGLTSETSSPNFRIDRGRVICVAQCDKLSLNAMLHDIGGIPRECAKVVVSPPVNRVSARITGRHFADEFGIEVFKDYQREDDPIEILLTSGYFVLSTQEKLAASAHQYETDPSIKKYVGQVLSFDGEYRIYDEGRAIWHGWQRYTVKVFGSCLVKKNENIYLYGAEHDSVEYQEGLTPRGMEEYLDRLRRTDHKIWMSKRIRKNGHRKYRRLRMRVLQKATVNRKCYYPGLRIYRIVRRKYVSTIDYQGTLMPARAGYWHLK